jgi:gas vesicle protein
VGLFKHKNAPISEPNDGLQAYFDEYFAELRNRGRIYFEKVIYENAAQFKADLDHTTAQVNTDLKSYMTKQLDDQFAEFTRSAKDTQEVALQSLTRSAQALEDQHKQLTELMQHNMEDQQKSMSALFEENKTRFDGVKQAQDAALEALNQSVADLQELHKRLNENLEKNVAEQEEALVKAFEQNMAQVVEHYLLGALGDSFDLKSQLPQIIKQLEANKQAIVDDVKL